MIELWVPLVVTNSTPLIIVNIIIYSNRRGQVMKNLAITPMLEESDYEICPRLRNLNFLKISPVASFI